MTISQSVCNTINSRFRILIRHLHAFIYLRYDMMKLYELIVVDAIIAMILGYARSSTGYMILLFVNFMFFLFKVEFLSRFIQKIVLYMTPIVAVLSVILSAFYPYSSVVLTNFPNKLNGACCNAK